MHRIIRAIAASALLTSTAGCARWHEFHSVQPYAGTHAPVARTASAAATAATAATRPLVVVLAGSEGTEIFDLLAPFAILARTGALDVQVIARDTAALPLWRGVALRPQGTLAALDADIRTPAAIVVPNFTDAQQDEIDAWIGRFGASGGWVLAVCEGARIIARAGLLDGRRATSHSESLDALTKEFRTVRWERGPRWVEDGSVITTAGVSASTEGALLLVERLLGVEARDRVMRDMAYPGTVPLAQFDARGIPFGDKLRLGRRALFGGTGRVVVHLEPDVDELMLGATLDTWARAFPKSLRTIAAGDQWVVTRHGLTLGPTARWTDVVTADELVTFSDPPASMRAMAPRARLTQLDPRHYPFTALAGVLTDRIGSGTMRAVFRTMDLPWTPGDL